MGGGLFARDEIVEEDIERLKEGDMLESSFGDFARNPLAVCQFDRRTRPVHLGGEITAQMVQTRLGGD